PVAGVGGGAALSRVEKELKALEEQERRAGEQKKEELKKLAAIQQQIEEKKKRIEEEKKSRVGDSAALIQAEKELNALEGQERQVEEQKKLATIQQQIEEKKRRVEEERKQLEKIVGKPGQPIVQQANRYAIVVGIEQYRERIPKADFADRDAKAVAQFLAKQGGYREENVIVRLNEQATKSDMEKYFEAWLKNNVDANSSVFIYFSGHGAPKAETGEAYIVPYDGDPAFIEQTGYPLKRLYQTLDKLPTKNVVVMLDSCFSGTGGRSVLAKGARPMALTVEGLSNSGTKTVVLSATSGSHISLADQEKGHGLFTYYALQGLSGDADANGDGAIDVQELFEFLKPQVQRVARRVYNTEQVPQLIIPSSLVNQLPPRLIER
ncbi:MAG: caspase family protein, partial [Nitrospirae bacterium]|nr:caspase family protein [Nitrospirota bacterium]